MTPRLVDSAELRLAGIRRRHAPGKMANESRRQWMDLVAFGKIPGQAALIGYGLHHEAPDARTMDYFTGVEVDGFDALPISFDQITLPARRYAVFGHRGHVNEARSLRDRIAGGGLTGLGLKPAAGPDFERFDEGFDPISATGQIELWFPIAR